MFKAREKTAMPCCLATGVLRFLTLPGFSKDVNRNDLHMIGSYNNLRSTFHCCVVFLTFVPFFFFVFFCPGAVLEVAPYVARGLLRMEGGVVNMVEGIDPNHSQENALRVVHFAEGPQMQDPSIDALNSSIVPEDDADMPQPRFFDDNTGREISASEFTSKFTNGILQAVANMANHVNMQESDNSETIEHHLSESDGASFLQRAADLNGAQQAADEDHLAAGVLLFFRIFAAVGLILNVIEWRLFVRISQHFALDDTVFRNARKMGGDDLPAAGALENLQSLKGEFASQHALYIFRLIARGVLSFGVFQNFWGLGLLFAFGGIPQTIVAVTIIELFMAFMAWEGQWRTQNEIEAILEVSVRGSPSESEDDDPEYGQ